MLNTLAATPKGEYFLQDLRRGNIPFWKTWTGEVSNIIFISHREWIVGIGVQQWIESFVDFMLRNICGVGLQITKVTYPFSTRDFVLVCCCCCLLWRNASFWDWCTVGTFVGVLKGTFFTWPPTRWIVLGYHIRIYCTGQSHPKRTLIGSHFANSRQLERMRGSPRAGGMTLNH